MLDCTLVIGYLHRGIEKILENRPMLGGIRYMDNAGYLSPVLNESAYAGAVEQLMEIEPFRCAGHHLPDDAAVFFKHLWYTCSWEGNMG